MLMMFRWSAPKKDLLDSVGPFFCRKLSSCPGLAACVLFLQLLRFRLITWHRLRELAPSACSLLSVADNSLNAEGETDLNVPLERP